MQQRAQRLRSGGLQQVQRLGSGPRSQPRQHSMRNPASLHRACAFH